MAKNMDMIIRNRIMAVSLDMIINQKKKRTKAMVENMDKRQMKNRIIADIMDMITSQKKKRKKVMGDIMDMLTR